MSEPDLDAMLDDALDVIDTQEREHAAVKDAEDKRVAQLAEEMTTSGGAAGNDPELQNLQQMFTTLASALQNPEALESTDGIAQLQATLNGTIAQLANDPNATEDEKAELQRCAGLVENLGKEDGEMSEADTARAQEAIADMMKNMGSMRGGADAAAAAAAGGNSDGAATADGAPPPELDQLLKMMEQFHKTAAEDAAKGGNGAEGASDAETHAQMMKALEALHGDVAAASKEAGAQAAGAAADGSEGSPDTTDAAALQIVSQMWSDPAFCDPFKQMCAKFPGFLEEKEASGALPAAELDRFRAQHRAMQRVVDLLGNGPALDPNASSEETAAKFGAISEALEQLQALGAPPAELVGAQPEGEK